MARDNGDGGSFWSGFLLGAIVGAALAAFLAPKPSEETRQQLLGKQEEFRSMAEDFTARAKGILDEQMVKLQAAVEEARAAAEKTREELIARFREEAEGKPGA